MTIDKAKKYNTLSSAHAKLTDRLQLFRSFIEEFKENQDLDPKLFLAKLEKSAQEIAVRLEKARVEANALYKEINKKEK